MPLVTPLSVSVLELAPIVAGDTERRALERTVALAPVIERLGYERLWVAEHHALASVASSAPDLLAMRLADATSTIRVGSGGVMLPNHAPLAVAERFAMLEALHPRRIDLGIGRAPGTDQRTAAALRRTAQGLAEDDFIGQLQDLMAFFDGDFPPGHPYEGMRSIPGLGLRPPIWLLGSSGFSARVAAALGQRFAFAYHFSSQYARPALAAYRAQFQPGQELTEPYAILTVSVCCAPTDEEARWLARSGELAAALRLRGSYLPFRSPEEADAYDWAHQERAAAADYLQTLVVGSPDTVAAELRRLATDLGAQEVMVTTTIWDEEAKTRSFELVAAAMGLDAPS
jgi:luciferase family oxidoreductase group 1